MSACMIYVTTSTREEAIGIARQLVESRLAACANVLPAATSIYWWQGALQEDSEAVLIVKTRRDLVGEVTTKVKELHSYDCPCVVSIHLEGGNEGYFEWIAKETR
ncbi:MAG: divalent-cation tolerance protein CutA [Rhodospirillales bacterium]|nr:divalent-cation tolerance protein CutA [Rhodospirillales bacterium]HIJ44224.1 divalent-cation tolerance protein CutA [Rhodospirillaceae bacterium]MDP7098516.1 divalent-cation tolerance protein CutA [Rhodospirillales bacterium]MDP7214750.1 divalent-cation tolerance protein CutA [Rhodospirillales bacterium]HIJ92010.1 divalent-cation tolerance protein CutA [Rhodospirillaceae bacterium]